MNYEKLNKIFNRLIHQVYFIYFEHKLNNVAIDVSFFKGFWYIITSDLNTI